MVCKERQITGMSTDELLDVSQILMECVRSGKVNLTSQSPKVRKYVRSVTTHNNPMLVKRNLGKVNKMIVTMNARENRPTKTVKRIYKEMLEED